MPVFCHIHHTECDNKALAWYNKNKLRLWINIPDIKRHRLRILEGVGKNAHNLYLGKFFCLAVCFDYLISKMAGPI